jgi:trigger factor
VPRSVVESRFGQEVRSEVIRRLVEEAVWQAVQETDLHPIAQPEVEGIDAGDARPLSFTARVDVRPAFEVADPSALKVDKVVYPIQDEEVGGVLESLRESWTRLEPVDRPAAPGDVVMVDLADLAEGQVPLLGRPRRDGLRLELGPGRLPEPWIAALTGRGPGDSVVVEVPSPREGEVLPPGAPRYHRLTVKQVEAKHTPALDDAFAEQVSGGKVKTVDELRGQIRTRLEADEEHRAGEAVERDLLDRLAAGIRFEIPERIVRPLADRMFARAMESLPALRPEDRERLAVESRQAATVAVRRELVVAALARAQAIDVSDEEANTELRRRERRAERAGEPVESASGSERASRLERVRDGLVERKVLKYLVDKADVQVVQAPAKQKRIVTPYDP